jgi:xanthine dehydrogenase accessory factor
MENMSEIYREIDRMLAGNEKAVLVSTSSVRASAPSEKETKMLVKADGSTIGTIGGGGVEADLVKEALDVIKHGVPRRVRLGVTPEEEKKRGMEPGGKLKYFIEPIQSLPVLYIFGGGNISQQIAKIGKALGFKIIVVDNQAEFANPSRFGEADTVIAEDYDKAFSKLLPGKSSYIIIATRNHECDEQVLEKAVKSDAEYVGMAACSETKKQRFFSNLTVKGISTERFKKVHAPIGLNIRAQTMEEMALSILAEIVQFHRSKF